MLNHGFFSIQVFRQIGSLKSCYPRPLSLQDRRGEELFTRDDDGFRIGGLLDRWRILARPGKPANSGMRKRRRSFHGLKYLARLDGQPSTSCNTGARVLNLSPTGSDCMPESSSSAPASQRHAFAGIVPILFSLLLAVIYFRVPQFTAKWSMPWHLFFRGLVVLIGLSGLIRLLRNLSQSGFRIPRALISQHRMFIPTEGRIYLGIIIVLFTGAMLTKQNPLLLVFALMAGPFVINGWMTFGMLQAARVQRELPRRAMPGELFPVEIQLRNSRPLFALWMMSIRDQIQHSDETLIGTVLFSRVSPRSCQAGHYQLRLSRRGRYRFGPLTCTSRFPLGLVERSRIFPVTGEILIYPRIGRIIPNWRNRLVGATELVSRNQPHHGVFHDDFNQLREFRSGDNPRAIHWRSTARRGELILREFHQNREHTLAVVLDLFGSRSERNKTSQQNEFALSFVASLLTDRGRECRDGVLTLAAVGEGTFFWEGQGNTTSLESLFDGLAILEPGPSNGISEILKEAILKAPSTAQIVLVTTRRGILPYQSLLTPRIDLLNLSEVAADQLMTFDDDLPSMDAG